LQPYTHSDQKEYKRLVNIYNQQEKVVSLKSKRKSMQPSHYSRINYGVESRVELPDIYGGSGKTSHLRHYNQIEQRQNDLS
jgi:hypothetical protein